MSSFYQPASTQGIYDATARRLTVNCGDSVAIGFRASPKSLNDLQVDADDAQAILGRYEAGPSAIELQVDTSRPLRFNLEATETPTMSAPRAVVQPLEVVVRLRNFDFYSPVGQWKDASACWAACLSWWLGVQDDRLPLTYNHFLMMFHNVWLRDGSISISGLQQGLRSNDSHFRMHSESILPPRLPDYFGRWPLMVGFKAPGGFGHMNVLYAYDQAGTVSAMEPWSPDPGDDVDVQDGVMYLTKPDFEFRGAYVKRPVSYYQTPVSAGRLFIGYPAEYLKRMPG